MITQPFNRIFLITSINYDVCNFPFHAYQFSTFDFHNLLKNISINENFEYGFYCCTHIKKSIYQAHNFLFKTSTVAPLVVAKVDPALLAPDSPGFKPSNCQTMGLNKKVVLDI